MTLPDPVAETLLRLEHRAAGAYLRLLVLWSETLHCLNNACTRRFEAHARWADSLTLRWHQRTQRLNRGRKPAERTQR